MITDTEKQIFLKLRANQEQVRNNLLKENATSFEGVEITVSSDFRELLEKGVLEAKIDLLLIRLHESKPLLKIFPDLNVLFEEKTVDSEIFSRRVTSVPEFLYENNSHTLIATSRAIPAEGVFTHELGHHIHSYFTPEQQLALLNKQNWKIKDGHEERDATFDDLLKQMNAEPIHGDSSFIGWGITDSQGNRGKRYRHSNPCEMVAEVVAENREDIFRYISENNLNDQTGQKQVIDFIIQKLPSS